MEVAGFDGFARAQGIFEVEEDGFDDCGLGWGAGDFDPAIAGYGRDVGLLFEVGEVLRVVGQEVVKELRGIEFEFDIKSRWGVHSEAEDARKCSVRKGEKMPTLVLDKLEQDGWMVE